MVARLGPDAIRSILAADHDLEVDRVVPDERGTVAETWVATCRDGRRFVKVVPIGRDSPALERSLPLQVRLSNAGFTAMARPIPVVGGALAVRRDEHVVVVFEWIDGLATHDYPFEAYVDLVASLHSTTIDAGNAVETFAVDTTALVGPFVERARRDRRLDALTESVGTILDQLGPSLDEDIREAHRIRLVLAARNDVCRVMTHYDAANNVLVRPDGSLVLVDFDDLLLAPPERDTWKHLVDPDQAPRFLARYRHIVPGYEPDPEAITHYLRKWYFEEVEGLGGVVLDVERPLDERQRYLGWFSAAVPHFHAVLRHLERGERPWASAVAEATSAPAEHRQRQPDDQHDK